MRKEKLSILAIHIGMILTLVGAGVTHYIGFEGIIRLKEGDITNTMWSAEPYMEMMVVDKESGKSYRHPLLMNSSEHLNNYFEVFVFKVICFNHIENRPCEVFINNDLV